MNATPAKPAIRAVTVAHSPDSDDAFMFYGLAAGKVPTGNIDFKHVLRDIQSLNEEAQRGTYEVTAISFHAYAYVAEKYALLPHGASIGDNYGPVVVAREAVSVADLPRLRVAVPGTLTTAFLALRLLNPNVQYEVVPFDQIIGAVKSGRCGAGLLIHEGQLFYETIGLKKVVDLGEWWHETTGLPLPVGGNAVRRDLGTGTMRQVSACLRQSILYSLEHREEALAYAMQFARDMSPALADRFVAMWVNDLTLDYTDRGREAVHRLLSAGHERGIIPHAVAVDFVS